MAHNTWSDKFPFPEQLRVAVEAEHIEKGERWSATVCAMALAIRKRLPGYEVAVSEDEAWIGVGGETAHYKITPRAKNFIHEFDIGYPVGPSRFVLRLTETVLREGGAIPG